MCLGTLATIVVRHSLRGGRRLIDLTRGTFERHVEEELSGLLKKRVDVAAVVLGFSSPNCHRCIVVENEYDAMLKQIDRDEGIAVTNYGKNGKASTTGIKFY